MVQKELYEADIELSENDKGETVINGMWTLHEEIGRGAFCSVVRATGYYEEEMLSIPYAIKVYNRKMLEKIQVTVNGPQKKRARVDKELDLWGSVDHPNIVKGFELMESPDCPQMYLLMQYADLGTIADYDEDTEKFKPNQKILDCLKLDHAQAAKKIFKDVVEGLNYLHNDLKVAHRDIKPDNILFATQKNGTNDQKPDRAQIADFTCVCKLPCMVTDQDGTPAFLPPESHEGEEYDPTKQDMWALGVTMYCYCFGKLPFDKQGVYEYSVPGNAGTPLFDLLSKLLKVNPNERLTATQVLTHDYFA